MSDLPTPEPPVALVVGASSAIGRAIGAHLHADGYDVVGASLDEMTDPAYKHCIVADCATPPGARAGGASRDPADRPARRGDPRSGRHAGGARGGHHDEQWRAGLGATLDSAFFVLREALPRLRAGSSVVAISSVNATLAAPGVPAYAAAKAGLEGLVRQLALDYGPRGIRVNAVAPGMIGPSDLADVTEGYPLGRIGTPDDVAAAVSYLASPAAGFVTGVVLPVDGGLSISSPAAWLRPDLRRRFL